MKSPSKAELLALLPSETQPLVRRVLRAADAESLRVYLVGGPVRDWLMQRSLRDVDLCVEPRENFGAVELARAMQDETLRVRVHDRFGTVTLDDAASSIDLATVRSETYEHAGALPSVTSGSLEQDLLRRDFSVNAMALPLSHAARARGKEVVDVAGGLEDLKRGRLRILHAKSFHDDPTRALRAARLAPRLGLTIGRESRVALRSALRDGVFGGVSGDRLRRELARVFEDVAMGLDPGRALRLLQDWHVLAALEPGLALDRAAALPLRRLGRTLASPPWPPGRQRAWVPGFGLWLAPLPLALRRRALRRFSIRGDVAELLVALPKRCDAWSRGLAKARGRGAVDAVLAGIDEESLLALHSRVDTAARRRVARWAAQDRARKPPISGDDLVEIGLAGPALGRVLRRVRTQWLDGNIRDRDEALALAQEMFRRGRR